MLRSLQVKLTLALLLTSVASVALVGLVARSMLLSKFNQLAMAQSLAGFRDDLQAYISAYGTWEKAQQTTPLPNFIQLRHGGPPQQGQPAGGQPGAGQAGSLPALSPNGAPPSGAPQGVPPVPQGAPQGSGQMPSGQMPQGQMPQGQMPQGQMPPGQGMQGQGMQGQGMQGQGMQGQPPQGQGMQGQMPPGQPPQGQQQGQPPQGAGGQGPAGQRPPLPPGAQQNEQPGGQNGPLGVPPGNMPGGGHIRQGLLPDGLLTSLPPLMQGQILPNPGNGTAPNGGQNNGQEPPPPGGQPARFRFIVLDPSGKVLLGPPELRNQMAPATMRQEAEPVMVNGKTALLVVPNGDPEFTQEDIDYLDAMKAALLRGILAATLFALVMGVLLGNGLSRKLRQLTDAIEAMGEGELRQQVEVQSSDEVGVLAHAFNRMSSELAQAHEKLQESYAQISKQATMLKELSVRDELTKLYNRRHFDTRVSQVFAQANRYKRPLAVMIGDIDHFKKINDTFSHAIGDEVLRHVAAILQKNTRESDIVARYGGEEFVIAFPETPLPQAAALCERLRQQIEAYPWQQIHPDLRVTMSMGLNNDLQLSGFEKMVAAADALLYRAKESGRNRLCFPAPPPQAQPAT